MKVLATLLALVTVAASLPGSTSVESGELEAGIYCPGRTPPFCITKRAVQKRAEEGEVEAAVGCPYPWCITKRAEQKRAEENAEGEAEASVGCPFPWCITKRFGHKA